MSINQTSIEETSVGSISFSCIQEQKQKEKGEDPAPRFLLEHRRETAEATSI